MDEEDRNDLDVEDDPGEGQGEEEGGSDGEAGGWGLRMEVGYPGPASVSVTESADGCLVVAMASSLFSCFS